MYNNNNILENLAVIKYLLQVLTKFILKINYKKNKFDVYINSKNIEFISLFFKNHFNLQFKNLISIHGIDYIYKHKRFEITYNLLSILYNYRISIKLQVSELTTIPSITKIFKTANWYEREVWDMFGVYFSNHPDLRRILTDYGFEGYPFRKDFPQTGYLELRYDDELKYIIYEPVELAQEYRFFEFNSPWIQIK